MIIVRRAWRDIPDGALVVDPAGRIWRLLGKFTDNMNRPYVRLLDPVDPAEGDTTGFDVNPDHTVDTITTDLPLEHAVRILAGTFALERI